MRKDLFDQLVESMKQMKAIEAGRLKPGRVTRVEDLVQGGTPDVAAPPGPVFSHGVFLRDRSTGAR